jgi:hypothetical protein
VRYQPACTTHSPITRANPPQSSAGQTATKKTQAQWQQLHAYVFCLVAHRAHRRQMRITGKQKGRRRLNSALRPCLRLDRTYLSADALLPGSFPAPTGPALRWAIRKLTIKNASPFIVYATAKSTGDCAVRQCSTRSDTLSNVNGRKITIVHCTWMPCCWKRRNTPGCTIAAADAFQATIDVPVCPRKGASR